MFSKRTLTELDKKLLQEKYPNDYEELIKKVENDYPIQYLIGNVDFLNVTINVNESVLIPRFETEYLVEKVLKKVSSCRHEPLNMLDICTGSGCIAIAVAKNTNFRCFGIDISKDALQVAKENSKKNNTIVQFEQFDILKESLNKDYDIIISNPPYISKEEIVDNSTRFEPDIALYAEDNGLIFYKKILEQIKNKPKLIAFEIGEMQEKAILELCTQKFPTAIVTCEKDLCGKNRYIFIEHSLK